MKNLGKAQEDPLTAEGPEAGCGEAEVRKTMCVANVHPQLWLSLCVELYPELELAKEVYPFLGGEGKQMTHPCSWRR